MKIAGRTLYPGSIFFEELWTRLGASGFDGHAPPLVHTDAALIGHELLLASEFCEGFELNEIARHFHLSEMTRFDLIRRYRLDVAKYVRERAP